MHFLEYIFHICACFVGLSALILGLTIAIGKLIVLCIPQKKPMPVRNHVPENLRLTDDRNDPDGWEEFHTGFNTRSSLLRIFESQGFCKERIDRFAKRYPDEIIIPYTTIYI